MARITCDTLMGKKCKGQKTKARHTVEDIEVKKDRNRMRKKQIRETDSDKK